jgi:hypothetical protein
LLLVHNPRPTQWIFIFLLWIPNTADIVPLLEQCFHCESNSLPGFRTFWTYFIEYSAIKNVFLVKNATVTIQVASEFYRYGCKHSTLEHSFQFKPASPHTHTQNMSPSHPEPNNTWTTVSHKRGRQTHEEAQREAKHIMESEYWFHPTPTSSRYTALLEEDDDQQHQKVRLGTCQNLHQSM